MKKHFRIIGILLALMIFLVSCNTTQNYEKTKVLYNEKDIVVDGKTILTIDDFAECFDLYQKLDGNEIYDKYACRLGMIYIFPSSQLAHKAYIASIAELGGLFHMLYRINNVVFHLYRPNIFGEYNEYQKEDDFDICMEIRDRLFEFLGVDETEWISIVYPYEVCNRKNIDAEKLLGYFQSNDSFNVEQVNWGDLTLLGPTSVYRYSKKGYIISNKEKQLFMVIRLHETKEQLEKLRETDEKYYNLMPVQDQIIMDKMLFNNSITGFVIYNEPYTIWLPNEEWLEVIDSI